MIELGTLIERILASSGVSGAAVAVALIYLSFQVKGLQKSVDKVSEAITKDVFPRLDDHQKRLSRIEGRLEGGANNE